MGCSTYPPTLFWDLGQVSPYYTYKSLVSKIKVKPSINILGSPRVQYTLHIAPAWISIYNICGMGLYTPPPFQHITQASSRPLGGFRTMSLVGTETPTSWNPAYMQHITLSEIGVRNRIKCPANDCSRSTRTNQWLHHLLPISSLINSFLML